MSKRVWLVTSGSYSDYHVLVVALTQEDAQQYADAYNAARESRYRDDAEVEEVELFAAGDPLPRSYTGWNADKDREWPYTQIVTGPDLEPVVENWAGRGPFARNYPSREAARAAVDNYKPDPS